MYCCYDVPHWNVSFIQSVLYERFNCSRHVGTSHFVHCWKAVLYTESCHLCSVHLDLRS